MTSIKSIKERIKKYWKDLNHECRGNEIHEFSINGWNQDGTKASPFLAKSGTKSTCKICGRVRIEHDQR